MPAKPTFATDAAFPNSKEALSIPRRYRLAAIGAWDVAGAWSCSQLSDGWVPVWALNELLITRYLAGLLVQSTLWIPAVDTGPTAIEWELEIERVGNACGTRKARATAVQFTNWPKWQKTREQWLKEAAANARRQRDFQARRSAHYQRIEADVTNTLFDVGVAAPSNTNGAPNNGLLHEREEKRSTSVETKGVSAVGSVAGHPPQSPSFENHCAKHRHVADPPSCRACQRTREDNEAAAQQHADAETVKQVAARDANKRRLANCVDCDEYGWRLDIWGEQTIDPPQKCAHSRVVV